MRPYGLPRNKDIEFPDVADIQNYGLSSHVGKFREKCGIYKPYIRNTEKRNSTRRYWKRTERMVSKHDIIVQLNSIFI
jgi:hypothetical protein